MSKCPCLQMEGRVPPPMDWWSWVLLF
jgi:hypothetical protein